MKLKVNDLEITEKCPFENDALKDREEAAKVLTGAIDVVETPYVFALNAGWGQGKTTFLRMLEQHLRNQGHEVMYFSAWESDYADDPLTVILSEMGNYVKNCSGELESLKELFVSLKGSAVKMLIGAIPDLAKKYLTETAGKEFDKRFEYLKEWAAIHIDGCENNKDALVEFKEKLSNFAKAIVEKNDQEQTKPFVILVDELDRCRPDYAIKFLEKIKHLFNVESIVFVVAIDKKEVEDFIPVVYGNINANEYLQRFFDIEFYLSSKNNSLYAESAFKRIELNFKNVSQNDSFVCKTMFAELIGLYRLTLREVNLCVTELAFVLHNLKEHESLYYAILLTVLIVLKIKKPNLYYDFIHNIVDEGLIIEDLKKNDTSNVLYDNKYYRLWVMLAMCRTNRDNFDSVIKKYEQKLQKEPDNQVFDCILKSLRQGWFTTNNISIEQVLEKMELFGKYF